MQPKPDVSVQQEAIPRWMLESLHRELHAIAQPLSSLQCCLELGILQEKSPDARERLELSLRELYRVNASVAAIRSLLQETSPGEQGQDAGR